MGSFGRYQDRNKQDEQHGSGCCDAGSSMSLHNTQPPNSNMTSSAAAMQVTLQHYMQSLNSKTTSSGNTGSSTPLRDSKTTSSGDTGSGTPPYNSETTSSMVVVAAMWAAAHHRTTVRQ